MCRLYGFRANAPTKVECGLVLAQNSLLAQSRSDSRGTTHADGWGIATFPNGLPKVVRRGVAAFEGLHFSTTAERVYARTVVAHVRNATVGGRRRENTHPFCYGRWIFAHNGTVREFEAVRSRLEQGTPEPFRLLRRGSSDSEAAFCWLLARMHSAGIDLDSSACDLDLLADLVADSIPRIEEFCRAEGADVPSRLNWILTNGSLMIATRWNNDLHLLVRRGVHDCEICGIPHIEDAPREDYRAVVVASEPISQEEWRDVPERSLVLIDRTVGVRVRPL